MAPINASSALARFVGFMLPFCISSPLPNSRNFPRFNSLATSAKNLLFITNARQRVSSPSEKYLLL